MICTNELRFVEREVYDPNFVGSWETVRVLQQKWRHKDYPIVIQTEWRDVPLVKEEA